MHVGDKVLYRGEEMTISWVGRELITAVTVDERSITAAKSRFKSVRKNPNDDANI